MLLYHSVSTTSSALSRITAILTAADVCVRRCIFVPLRAMRFGSIAFELHGGRAMQVVSMRLGHGMRRVAARRVIARVAGFVAALHRSVRQLPSVVMGRRGSLMAIRFSDTKHAVAALFLDAAFPWPAFVSTTTLDLCPEALGIAANNHIGSLVSKRVAVAMPAVVVIHTPTPR